MAAQLKIGIQLASLGLPFKQGLEAAARMGVAAVEIDARNHLRASDLTETGLRHLLKLLRDTNLKVCAVGFRTRHGYNVLDRLQERIDATKKAMSLAYSLGANVVVNQIGRIPTEASGAEWDLLVDAVSDLGRHAHHCGAFLAAETGGESGSELASFIGAIPEGSMGITLNPGNLLINRFSPAEVVEAVGQHVMYVHAKDGVQDLAQGRGVEVPLGRGSADFPNLLGALEEHAYRGYFTVERENSPQPLEEVTAAVEYLRNI